LDVSLHNVDLEINIDFFDLMPEAYIKLTVRDTGCGIDHEITERIFDPFFTTKGVGEGTGMGLAVVHGIVKNIEGTVSVESEPEKGTAVEVLFPCIEAEQAPEEIEKQEKLPTGNERILLVDDEEGLVRAYTGTLKNLGYDVEAHTNPIETLEAFQAEPDRFDLVITDMTMPQMTGEKLVQELIKIRSDISVILCTGYSERIDKEKAKTLGIRAYVMKPFETKTLAQIVRKVLDEEKT